MQLFFLRFLKKLLKIIFKIYFFIKEFIFEITLFFQKKLGIYYVAYKIRKKSRLKFYRFLYINYYFFYKKRSLIQNEFSKLKEEDLIKYTNQAISLTFNFYSFNFEFIYF